MRSTRFVWLRTLSPEIWSILILAVLSTVGVMLMPKPDRGGAVLWTFIDYNGKNYASILAAWNREHPDTRLHAKVIEYTALQRRMLTGFFSGTPTADLLEVERSIANRAFIGPLDRVGFVDLTDYLRADGLTDEIASAVYTPWSSRGRIFGIPIGFHPVLLAYRADLVEAAGIDVSQIETWDDFFRLLRPLMTDRNGDGQPDRYLLSGWNNNPNTIDILLLQADAQLFDPAGRPTLDTPRNAEILSRLVSWFAGPNRIAADASDFTFAGNRQRLEGYVVATFMPDWLAGSWRKDLTPLAGKVKLMPLPAWERGGRRTSAWGGTMIGIAKSAPRPAEKWELVKMLYFSRELAETNFNEFLIVSPLRRHHHLAIYDRPDPYFCGQPVGRLYLNQENNVPARPSSPYTQEALRLALDVLGNLKQHAEATGRYDAASLEPLAHQLLTEAQRSLLRQIDRNPFLLSAP